RERSLFLVLGKDVGRKTRDKAYIRPTCLVFRRNRGATFTKLSHHRPVPRQRALDQRISAAEVGGWVERPVERGWVERRAHLLVGQRGVAQRAAGRHGAGA